MRTLTAIALTAFFLISSSLAAQSNEKVKFLIDTCIQIMKSNAVNKDKINWKELRETAFVKATAIHEPYQLGSVIRYLYQSLNDFHGAFYYRDSTFKWSRSEPLISDSIMNEWKKGISIRCNVLPNNIGYLRVPFMSFSGKENDDKNAQMLNDSLCSLLQKKIKGLVLDLRLNGGGSMFPMILGLKQLLVPGKVGHFVGTQNSNWYLKENNFLLDTTIMATIQPTCDANAQNIPVVVLIGQGTGSSGEFLTMAVKTRKKTILLGTKTAGYVTATAGFPVNEDAFVLLSTGYGADRNGIVYKKAIKPNIMINAIDQFNNIVADAKVQAAMKWINEHLH